MKTGIQQKESIHPDVNQISNIDEVEKITNFLNLLIEIDQRIKRNEILSNND